MTRTDSDRDRALDLLARFERLLLPGVMRRIATWKGISGRQLDDWHDDVRQDLALDCLENTERVLSLPDRDRHRRWMRCAERSLYRLRRGQLQAEPFVAEPTASERPWPNVELPQLVTLSNGRTNVSASSRGTADGRRRLRRRLDHLAAHLGWDREQQAFWTRRVAEALTGLAADLLRHRRQVLLLAPPADPPDLVRRTTRLRRLCRRFPIQPSTMPVRRALRPWHRSRSTHDVRPRQLLEQATRLDAGNDAGWWWLFEACCAERDVRTAAHTLWRLRHRTPSRHRLVLARARLRELRRGEVAALAVLRRAARRGPRDDQLQRARLVATARTPAR